MQCLHKKTSFSGNLSDYSSPVKYEAPCPPSSMSVNDVERLVDRSPVVVADNADELPPLVDENGQPVPDAGPAAVRRRRPRDVMLDPSDPALLSQGMTLRNGRATGAPVPAVNPSPSQAVNSDEETPVDPVNPVAPVDNEPLLPRNPTPSKANLPKHLELNITQEILTELNSLDFKNDSNLNMKRLELQIRALE